MSYIIFINTYIFKKDNASLKEDKWLKIPLLALTVVSSIIIVSIMTTNNSDWLAVTTTILLLLNIVIITLSFQKNNGQPSVYKDCVNTFFGYGTNNHCPLPFLTVNGEPLASYILPVLFGLLFGMSFNSDNKINTRLLFGIFSCIIFIEYFYKKRYNSIESLINYVNSMFNIPFIGYIVTLVYISGIVLLAYFMS